MPQRRPPEASDPNFILPWRLCVFFGVVLARALGVLSPSGEVLARVLNEGLSVNAHYTS